MSVMAGINRALRLPVSIFVEYDVEFVFKQKNYVLIILPDIDYPCTLVQYASKAIDVLHYLLHKLVTTTRV